MVAANGAIMVARFSRTGGTGTRDYSSVYGSLKIESPLQRGVYMWEGIYQSTHHLSSGSCPWPGFPGIPIQMVQTHHIMSSLENLLHTYASM
jgi:hypothetical protein